MLHTVDMTAHPYLSGRFAPAGCERDVADLRIEGSLPPDLDGAFMRNGPNPRFPPLGSYTYPMEGDGMIHAVWISGGRARYRNRWVRTSGLLAEERAGRALYGGIMKPAFVDPALLGADRDPGWPVKLDPFINIIRHAGHYLALAEGIPPYELTPELATLGRFDFGGQLPLGICAHPRRDPVTGELVVFRYDSDPPYLTWATVAPDGTVIQPATEVPRLEQPAMVHDFAITEHYAVFVIGPAIIHAEALAGSGAVVRWQPGLGTRIVVVPRSGPGTPAIAETDPFWAWHLANAYEDGTRVVTDFPWRERLTLAEGGGLAGSGQQPAGRLARLTVDPARGTADLVHVGSADAEFPRIDDRLTGREHRYLTGCGRSGRPGLAAGEYDRLVRYDMATGESVRYDTGAAIGEAVFVPRAGATGELDGYYLCFGRSLADDTSWLYVWDAADFPGPPRARAAIPAPVPNGMHANWFAA